MKRLVICIVALFSLYSCSTYKAPGNYDFNKIRDYNMSFDEVWGKVIEWFAENGIPIKNIEKASGLITTEYNLSASNSPDCLDCGTGGFGQAISDYEGTFNVVVKEIGKKEIRVTVTTFFNGVLETANMMSSTAPPSRKTIRCNSTGILEKELLDYIGKVGM